MGGALHLLLQGTSRVCAFAASRSGSHLGCSSRPTRARQAPGCAGFHTLSQACHPGLISDCWHCCVWAEAKGGLPHRHSGPAQVEVPLLCRQISAGPTLGSRCFGTCAHVPVVPLQQGLPDATQRVSRLSWNPRKPHWRLRFWGRAQGQRLPVPGDFIPHPHPLSSGERHGVWEGGLLGCPHASSFSAVRLCINCLSSLSCFLVLNNYFLK